MFPLMNHDHSPVDCTLARVDRWPRCSWVDRWSTMENDNGSAARCNSDSKNVVRMIATLAESPVGTHGASRRATPLRFRRARRQTRRTTYCARVRSTDLASESGQAIEGVGGLLGVLLGALPGIFERAGLLEMRPEATPAARDRRR